MDESKYNTYNYEQDTTMHSLNLKELDYNLVNEEQLSNTRKEVSKPTTRLRNNSKR